MEIEVIRPLFRKYGIEDVLDRIKGFIRDRIEPRFVPANVCDQYSSNFNDMIDCKTVSLKLIFHQICYKFPQSEINYLRLTFLKYIKNHFEEIFKIPYRYGTILKNTRYDMNLYYTMFVLRFHFNENNQKYLINNYTFNIWVVPKEKLDFNLDRSSDLVDVLFTDEQYQDDKRILKQTIDHYYDTINNILKIDYI